ncbi:MAG: efflux RND transporter periplasmic adaptor subunit [Burkholderiales bacterium]|nr:efflux RND transporter periplasmic adaptor subunit [Burkholderiales bacterium]
MKNIVLLLAIAVTVLSACAPKKEVVETVRPARVVRAVAADTQGMSAYAGEVRARYETDLAFRVPGKLLSRQVELGARVKKGQVLARLDPQDANLNAAASRATLASADSDLEFARAELKRYQELRDKNFVSQGVYDQKDNALKAAQARRDAAVAQSSVAGNQAGYTTLTADADGIVTAINADPGLVVAAGQPIVRVARLGGMDAIINVAENHLAGLRANPSARIALWALPGKVYNGRVREIAAAADAATRTYAVKVTITDADDALRWGMSAQVGFAAPGAASVKAILLPMTALTQTDDKSGARPAVWLVGSDGRVMQKVVEVARYTEQGVVLKDGLAGGELVVVAGVHKLAAGQMVKPVEEPQPASASAPSTAIADLAAKAPDATAQTSSAGPRRAAN